MGPSPLHNSQPNLGLFISIGGTSNGRQPLLPHSRRVPWFNHSSPGWRNPKIYCPRWTALEKVFSDPNEIQRNERVCSDVADERSVYEPKDNSRFPSTKEWEASVAFYQQGCSARKNNNALQSAHITHLSYSGANVQIALYRYRLFLHLMSKRWQHRYSKHSASLLCILLGSHSTKMTSNPCYEKWDPLFTSNQATLTEPSTNSWVQVFPQFCPIYLIFF